MNMIPVLPEDAPFSADQRAWLNGFLAGIFGLEEGAPGAAVATMIPEVAAAQEEDTPWHDPNLEMEERIKLAEGRGMPDRLMAAMAQLDCGQCGYVCRTYSIALASGEEKSTSLCSPGGKATQRKLKELLSTAPATGGESPHAKNGHAGSVNGAAVPSPNAKRGMDPKSPIGASLLEARPLNGPGSAKDTRLVRFGFEESIPYEAGDSLGVMPKNCTEVVERVLYLASLTGGESVKGKSSATRTLRDVLLEEVDLRSPSDGVLQYLASVCESGEGQSELSTWAEDGAPDGIQFIDVLKRYPWGSIDPQQLVDALEPLKPRLYSISSSPKAFPSEIHLTVGVVRYDLFGLTRKGVASTFLTERAPKGSQVPVFVKTAHAFRLPSQNDVPIIMIGPGTGVAPFRAFLQERRAVGAPGRNWLLFGDQRRDCDLLYAEEWEALSRDGYLHRFDLAFSRDGDEKVYVQHRLREHAAQVWSWLEDGAHLYICGDAQRMAKDVHRTLVEVIKAQGDKSTESAESYLNDLVKSGRYQRDVY